MLYLLLTEAAEGLWALTKITWNSGVGVYYWYYDETPKKQEDIEVLKTRIDELEKRLEDKK